MKHRDCTGHGVELHASLSLQEELGLTKKGGGDTDLCPFDCDCCY